MRSEFVFANGLRFHCAVAGEGPLLILLHGFPQFWYSWRHQIEALSRRFKVVAPDLRGYGESDKPAGVGAYALDTLAGDVQGLIRAFGAERAHVAGHDWGAAVAWAAAMTRPECVDRLIILNGPHPAAFSRALRARPSQMLRSWYIGFFQLPWLPERVLLRRGAVAGILQGSAARPEAFSAEDLARYEEAFRRPGAATASLNYYRAAFRGALGWLKLEKLPPVAAPTLVLWGERDQALGPELTEGLQRWVSGPLKVRRFPELSHWIQEEDPELVSRAIDDFLP